MIATTCLEKKEIPVVIFCGGRGFYLDDSGVRTNKALAKLDGTIFIEKVIDFYMKSGFTKFVLLLGYQGEVIRQKLTHLKDSIRFVETGASSNTLQRLQVAAEIIKPFKTFALCYSDTLSDFLLDSFLAAHIREKKMGIVLGARLPARFKVLGIRGVDNSIRGFIDQPVIQNDWINGGFYFFESEIFDEFIHGVDCEKSFEDIILPQMASRNQLTSYLYEGYWQYFDSERELEKIRERVKKGV